MKTTLLIMAAGIGSRFGTGIKQLEPVDDAGHIIMDYSIHDAIEAGFNHVVFIIRKDIEKEFKEVIGDRIASICSSHNVTVDYTFKMYTDMFLTEYIILAIHLNSQGVLSDVVLNKVKENVDLMI